MQAQAALLQALVFAGHMKSSLLTISEEQRGMTDYADAEGCFRSAVEPTAHQHNQ